MLLIVDPEAWRCIVAARSDLPLPFLEDSYAVLFPRSMSFAPRGFTNDTG